MPVIIVLEVSRCTSVDFEVSSFDDKDGRLCCESARARLQI